MCGRYYYDSSTEQDVRRLIEHENADLDLTASSGDNSFTRGDISQSGIDRGSLGEDISPLGRDICPSMCGVVICGNNNRLDIGKMIWGMHSPVGNKLLINARAESVLERPTFREHIVRRRCIIPAAHFYEWDREKNKAEFSLDKRTLYMCGFYDLDGRYVILTTAANASMIGTHDRMPLILDERSVKKWILQDDAAKAFLEMPSPMLTKKQEYEQLCFF